MVEDIIVSATTIGAWFKDLWPSAGQLPDYWPYLLAGVVALLAIFLLTNRR